MRHALYRFGLALMAGVMILSGCTNPLTGKPETGEALENRGAVQIQLGSPAARTLQPDLTGFSRYELDFAGPSGASHAQEVITSGSATVELSPGAWTITVTAYTGTGDGARKAATGSAGVTVSAGQTTTAAITLSPYTGEGAEKGTFTYTVAYPANLAEAKLYLTTADGKALTEGTIDLLGEDQRTGSRALDAGSYGIQVRLKAKDDLIAGKTESLHIYPALTTALNYTFTEGDFVAFAEVGDVTVSGTATYDTAGTGVSGEVRITVYNNAFKEAILDEDGDKVTAWFQNLPEGLSVTPKAAAVAGSQEITLTMSGTPTEPSSAELVITIPGEDLESGKDLTARSNPEAKFAIAYPAATATVGDVSLAGETGKALSGNVTITLQNARFTAIAGDASLTGWFNLPQGLSAVPSATVTAGAKTITVNISGTVASAVGSTALSINIPAEVLDRGAILPVTANPNATFTITDPPPKAVYLAGVLQEVYGGANTAKYWKYSTEGDLSTSHTLQGTGSTTRAEYTDIVVDSEGNLHFTGLMQDGDNIKPLYRKNDENAAIGFRSASPLTGYIGLAPDNTVYMVAPMRPDGVNVANSPWMYWQAEPGNTNPTMTELGIKTNTVNSIAGIAADDTAIYIAGRHGSTNEIRIYQVPRTDLSQKTIITLDGASLAGTRNSTAGYIAPLAMALSSDAIHLAGYAAYGTGVDYACYLKINKSSGVVEKTIISEDRSQALGITLSVGGEVYLAGYWKYQITASNLRDSNAAYWKVGNDTLELHILGTQKTTTSGTDDQGLSIALDGSDVYVAGYTTTSVSNTAVYTPVYWKDPGQSGSIETRNLETGTAGGSTQVNAIVVR